MASGHVTSRHFLNLKLKDITTEVQGYCDNIVTIFEREF